jgi:hypothetical protein
VGQEIVEFAKALEKACIGMQNWHTEHTKDYQMQFDELLEELGLKEQPIEEMEDDDDDVIITHHVFPSPTHTHGFSQPMREGSHNNYD